MLVDGLSIADNSVIRREILDPARRGDTFPASPTDGDVFELTAESAGRIPGIYVYISEDSSWVVKYPSSDAIPYDIAGAIFGTMNDADVVARHLSVRSYKIKADFKNCVAFAEVPGTADVSIEIYRIKRDATRVQLGTLLFSASDSVGVFSQIGSGDMLIGAGETLMLQAPNPVNKDLADIAFTFAGSIV